MIPFPIADDYRSPAIKPAWLARISPGLYFYGHIMKIVWDAARLAKAGRYSDEEWIKSSRRTAAALEQTGCELSVENAASFSHLPSPCVFVGNHMSTLETFVLPMLIRPSLPVTFVIKQSLVEYPVFKHVMRSRDPIVVGRKNPRDDLVAVLQGGEERIRRGLSIVVFPQTTRTDRFDPESFNSIGVKLAKRAGVPVVPVAIQSNAWGSGKMIKDFGPFRPAIPARFSFGDPLTVDGNGKATQEAVVDFIRQKLDEWRYERALPPAH